MPFKLTVIFGLNSKSWTESYLNSGSYPSITSQAAIQQLLSARGALLGTGAFITKAKVSSFPANRRVSLVDLGQVTTKGDWSQNTPTVENGAAIANDCMILRIPVLGQTKLIYMAGLPNGVIRADNAYPIDLLPGSVTGFTALVAAFAAALVAGRWGCRTWLTTPTQQAIGPPVAGPQNPPLIGIQTPQLFEPPIPPAPPAPLTAGGQVLLGGWRRANPRAPGLSGLFRVYSVVAPVPPATAYTYYLYGTQFVSPTNFKTIGTIGVAAFSVQPFVGLGTFDRGGTRKRGVRTDQPLGKSSRVH